jgi:hypothetical protein
MPLVGRVVGVEDVSIGSSVVIAASATDTELEVEDSLWYPQDGGTLQVTLAADGSVFTIDYDSVDDATDIITLSDPLPSNVAVDDLVVVYPPAYERLATIELEGADGVPVAALVPHALRLQIFPGVRGEVESAETVIVHEDEPGSFVITDVLGEQPSIATGDDPIIRPNGFPRLVAGAEAVATTTATDTSIDFTIIEIDTDLFVTANTARFRIPFDGQYDIRMSIQWALGGGDRRIWAERSIDDGANFTDLREEGAADDRDAVGGSPTIHGFAPPSITLQAGDLVRFRRRQESGSGVALQSARCQIMFIGPSGQQGNAP